MDQKIVASALAGGFIGGFASLLAFSLMNKLRSKKIVRLRTQDPRSSAIVIHNGLLYTSGQVGNIEKIEESDIKEQTKQTLAKLEDLMKEAGTNKSKIIEARIWIKDIKNDFQAMNEVWNNWIDPDNKGVRYCVESQLARPALLVEIQLVVKI